jgi:polysaccharide deacetylase family sporulation protein PdaB
LRFRGILKNKVINILLVFCIVFVSVIYSTGGGFKFLNVFLHNQKDVPISCVETAEKKIALTFDAAYGSQYTDEILNILDKNNVKATFFVVGNWIDKYSDKVKKINDKGHEIGNHSTTHPHFTQLTPIKMKEEIFNTSNKIKNITGENTIVFRPPFGDFNSQVVKTVQETGHYCILWDVDSLDWKNPGENIIYKKVVEGVGNGSVVLFHNNAEQTPKVLDKIIKDLKKRGYSFVKISDLIYKDGYYIDHTGRQRLIK